MFRLLTIALGIVSLSTASAAAAPVVTRVLAPGSQLMPGEYLWNPELGMPGAVEIVVDVAAERIYVYKGGSEIGRSLIIYGDDDKPTPLGEFKVLEKDIDHVSNLYNSAPMPYMLRLTWGGVAIHGSGEDVDNRYATHGCIGLPDEFAALIYQITPKGASVTVTRNWMTNVYR